MNGSDGPAGYVNPKGDFTRDANYIATRMTADGREGYPVEHGHQPDRDRACGPPTSEPGSPTTAARPWAGGPSGKVPHHRPLEC